MNHPERSSLTRRDLLKLAGASFTIGGFHGGASAQAYPDKPVKMIIPYPAGGGADAWGRTVAAKLEKVLGQPVVFDYKPGGSTTIGAYAAARSPADGYTIFMIDSTAFAYVPNMRKINYDPIKSFTPVGLLGVGHRLLRRQPRHDRAPHRRSARARAAAGAGDARSTARTRSVR